MKSSHQLVSQQNQRLTKHQQHWSWTNSKTVRLQSKRWTIVQLLVRWTTWRQPQGQTSPLLYTNVHVSVLIHKKPHYKALKHIARYLAVTKTEGLTLQPSKPIMECYVNANFGVKNLQTILQWLCPKPDLWLHLLDAQLYGPAKCKLKLRSQQIYCTLNCNAWHDTLTSTTQWVKFKWTHSNIWQNVSSMHHL